MCMCPVTDIHSMEGTRASRKGSTNFYLTECQLKWVPGAKVERWHLKRASAVKANVQRKR